MRPIFITCFILCALLALAPLSLADPSAPGGSQQRMQAQGQEWLAGHTSLSDLSLAQKKAMLGYIHQPVPVWVSRFVPSRDPKDLPVRLDWRDNGGDFITPVRDQGDCGSCFVFSGIGAVEGVWGVKMAIDNPRFNLSEQFILSCYTTLGCGGGWMTEVLLATRDVGVPDEACFHYTASDSSCDRRCDDWALRTVGITDFQLVLDEDADTEEEYLLIIQALQEGPLTVGFDVYENFFDYEWGIYSPSGMYLGGHGVVIVGYDAESRYWICKNSWGSGWGDNGYFKIRWGKSHFGRETMLPITPPCTDEQIYVRPVTPGQDFIRYDDEGQLLLVRVVSDCLRGLDNVTVQASILGGVDIDLFDDGAHQDEAANDGIFGGIIPSGLLLPGESEIVIHASRDDYQDGELILRGTNKYAADLFVIADDGDADGIAFFGGILDELGINHDVWDISEQGNYPFKALQFAPAVIWYTGPTLGKFKAGEKTAMTQYLDAGGKILIIGQDLMQNIYDTQYQWTREYFHLKTYYNDACYEQARGVPGDFLTDGLGAELDFPFPNWTDIIKLKDDAAPIWRNHRDKVIGMRYPIEYDGEAPYRMVFSAFPLQAMPRNQALTYIDRVLEWFYHDECFDTDGDGYPIGGACTGELDCANDDPTTYPGAPEICDDGRDNDCNGLSDLDDPACEGWGEDDDTGIDDDDTDDDIGDDDEADDDIGADDDDDNDDNGCGC